MDEITSAAQMQQIDDNAAQTQQKLWYERDFTLEDAVNMIHGSMKSAVRNYVAVGFYLKAIRDRHLYEENGYGNFEEFVRDRLDKNKTWASRCIKVNDQLSKGGNSPLLDDRYQQYNISQLVELSYMTEVLRQQTEPEMTVAQLREMRQPKEKAYNIPYFELEGQLNIETDFPEYLPDAMAARPEADATLPSSSFTMDISDMLPTLESEESVAISQQQNEQMISAPLQSPETEKAEEREAYVHEQFRLQEEYLYPFAKRVIRENKGWFMEDYMGRVANVNTSEPLLKKLLGANDEGRQYNIDLEDKTVVLCLFKDRIDVHYFDSNEMLHTDGACEWFYFAAAVQAMWNEVTLKDARERAIGEKLVGAVEKEESDEAGSVAISQQESQAEEKPAVIDAEFTEINDSRDKDMTDLEIARKELERANNLLIKCLSDLPDENNIYIRGMKLKVAALASLVCDLDDIENPPPKPEQPELPILRNNDQRKEWLENFRSWPVWFEVPEASEVYYRYDLPDGGSIVICEYRRWIEWMERYADENPDKVGEREYLLKPGYHYLHDCLTNRTMLVEKLKEIQKKG